MGRLYTAEFNAIALTAQVDFFELVAPADAVVQVHRFILSQHTEVKDAEEEGLLVLMKRGEGTVTSGSGGTTPTARPTQKGSPAYGGTVEANNTTKMVVGTGAIVNLYPFGWNIRAILDVIFTPEERPVISPSDRITLELATTPADSITFNGVIVFEEIGG